MKFTSKKLKGIEPIIAVVILVAVTLVIGIAVVGWIMGWWTAIGRPPESLKITPIKLSSTYIEIYVCNDGSATADITSITITGLGGVTDIQGDKILPPGACGTIKGTPPTGVSSGVVYEIQVITAAGNPFKTVIRAE